MLHMCIIQYAKGVQLDSLTRHWLSCQLKYYLLQTTTHLFHNETNTSYNMEDLAGVKHHPPTILLKQNAW